MSSSLKGAILSAIIGSILGAVLLKVAVSLGWPIPLRRDQMPIFIIGISLFSFVFRLFFSEKEEAR